MIRPGRGVKRVDSERRSATGPSPRERPTVNWVSGFRTDYAAGAQLALTPRKASGSSRKQTILLPFGVARLVWSKLPRIHVARVEIHPRDRARAGGAIPGGVAQRVRRPNVG